MFEGFFIGVGVTLFVVALIAIYFASNMGA
jgi:hypothetical protein